MLELLELNFGIKIDELGLKQKENEIDIETITRSNDLDEAGRSRNTTQGSLQLNHSCELSKTL